MNKAIIFLVLAASASFAYGQNSKLLWQKTMGGTGDDVINAITSDENDNIFVVGTTQEGFLHKIFIARLDQNGTTLWKQELSGNGDDQGVSLLIDQNDELVVLASSSSTQGLPISNKGGDDLIVARYSKNGELLDLDNYGGSKNETASSIVELPNGNMLVSGSTRSNDIDISNNKGQFDLWVLEIDHDGSIVWGQTYGGSDDDMAVNAIPLEDGNYLLGGQSASYDEFTDNRGDFDIVMLKIGPTGDLIWKESFGGSYSEHMAEVIQLPSGNIMFAGSTFSSDYDVSFNAGRSDIWVGEVDSNGALIWEQSYGSEGNETASTLAPTSAGFRLLGTTTSDVLQDDFNNGGQDFWMYEINHSKNIIHQQLFGASGFESGTAMIIQKDGSILLGGSTNSIGDVAENNLGDKNGWIFKIKTDASGLNEGITSVHPNPTSNVIYVNQLEPNSKIVITDLSGQVVLKSETRNEFSALLDLSLLPSGAYIVDVHSVRGKESHRLVKL